MNARQMRSLPMKLRRFPALQGSILDLASGLEVSAADLKIQIDERRISMEKLGFEPDQRIYIEAVNSVGFFVDFFAISEIGAVSFLVDSSQTPLERERVCKRIGPHFQIDSTRKIESGEAGERAKLPDGAAFVLFTSGTTAKPKAVVHTYSNIQARISAGEKAIPKDQRARALTLLPNHFAHGFISMCLSTLFLGETLLLPPSLSIDSFSKVSSWVQKYNVSFISGTPATWNLILRLSAPPATSSLRRVQIASAHSGFELFEKIQRWSGAPAWNVYGLTEAASWIADHRVQSPGDELIIGDGRAWNTHFEITDPDINGVGEVVFRSASLFAGYWDQGSIEDSVGSFATKDLGRIDSNGYVHLSGRMGRVINRGGIKVSPEEVELEIRKHPSVEDAFVLADIEGQAEAGIGALLVLDKDLALNAGPDSHGVIRDIEAFVAKNISSYKVPAKWIVVSSIPRRANGKPDLVQIGLLWKSLKTDA